jgi:beta-glucosidase
LNVAFSPDGSRLQGAETVLVVIGEQPYAEMKGDRADVNLAPEDIALVQKAKKSGARVVTLLLSGRPMILGEVLESSDAFVAAWLPGTEGQGVADVLLGAVSPRGKLPRSWPAANDQLDGSGRPLFSFGYGLTY